MRNRYPSGPETKTPKWGQSKQESAGREGLEPPTTGFGVRPPPSGPVRLGFIRSSFRRPGGVSERAPVTRVRPDSGASGTVYE
jgi:hypothetical protein